MIPLYGLGIVSLLAVLIMLSGNATNIRKALGAKHWLLGGATALFAIALLLTRPRLALIAITGIVVVRLFLSILSHLGSNASRTSGYTNAPHASSSVNTQWLHATLDHDSGNMDADIVDGPFTGQKLSNLTTIELLNLYALMAQGNAHDSMQIVEAFLDANHAHWRELAGDGESQRDAGGSVASRARALEILGLDDSADTQAIIAAHRRLIRAVHPDRGGSSYLAAQLNQARDLLLDA